MSKRSAFAKQVRDARRGARLTQVELAKRLGVSQTFVSMAESGSSQIGYRYVQSVLKECGLLAEGEDERSETGEQPQEGYVVGLDPETCEVVRRGSKRDEELRQKYVFWSNGYWAG